MNPLSQFLTDVPTVGSPRDQVENFLRAGFILQPHQCRFCRKWFLRKKKVSNPKRICGSDKCQKIARLGKEKPVGFDAIPGTCSPLLADITYHGRVMP